MEKVPAVKNRVSKQTMAKQILEKSNPKQPHNENGSKELSMKEIKLREQQILQERHDKYDAAFKQLQEEHGFETRPRVILEGNSITPQLYHVCFRL